MTKPPVLPYALIVGQQDLQTALEISFVDPGIGVLATGHRGTAKSTAIRAFSLMAFKALPVTLPIGATEDRVLGGLSVEALLKSEQTWQSGLLEQATLSEGKLLYIDEVNLLDDHLINIILDAASTGVLVVQRDNVDHEPISVRFALIGSMNPDEGGLRPQLLDRFGLVVTMEADNSAAHRKRVLENVLRFEEESANPDSEFLAAAEQKDTAKAAFLREARDRRSSVDIEYATAVCAKLAEEFELVGHRGEAVLLRAARALAALDGAQAVSGEHIRRAAKLAFVHRRHTAESGTLVPWDAEDDERVSKVLAETAAS